MAIQIVPYAAAHIPAVLAFNERLRSGDVNARYGLQSFLREAPTALQRMPGTGLYEDLFLAVDGDDVRGGYSLKHGDFHVNGTVRSVAFFQQPLSEGTIDRRHALVGPRLLRDALQRQPLLYGLGIGGYDQAAAKLLKGARFEIVSVPFLFRVEHARRFLRQVAPIRATPVRRLIADVAAATGTGAAGIWALQHRHSLRRPGGGGVTTRDVQSLAPAADPVWRAVRETLAFGAVRDGPMVHRLYDDARSPFLRVVIEEGGEPRGWAVGLATQRQGDKYFGDLKLGSIVDLLAAPGHESAIVAAAVDRLRRENVDLIVTNQTFGPVAGALRRHGFLSGPSNFLFAASPELAEHIGPIKANVAGFHINRGDGDGPINL
jgi:hypothetical protein